MAVVAEHAKVEALTLEGRVRATPLVEDLEFYLAFVKPCLCVLETLMENPYPGGKDKDLLDCLADPCQKFCDAVEQSDIPRSTETRSYILANLVLELADVYTHIGIEDVDWTMEVERLLPEIYFVACSLHLNKTVTEPLLRGARNVLFRLDELQHRGTELEIDEILNAPRESLAGY